MESEGSGMRPASVSTAAQARSELQEYLEVSMVCSHGRPWLASALARWLSFVKAVQERTKNP